LAEDLEIATRISILKPLYVAQNLTQIESARFWFRTSAEENDHGHDDNFPSAQRHGNIRANSRDARDILRESG
jgi:hypothetical protein